jgi:elongation factor 1-gamma
MSFSNSELQPPIGNYLGPLIGIDHYNKKNVDDAHKAALKAIAILEKHLLIHMFLVGERVTLADYFAAGIISKAFANVSHHFSSIRYLTDGRAVPRQNMARRESQCYSVV